MSKTGTVDAASPSALASRAMSDAVEQQAATAEILRVISRSPGDAQPVFDTIAAAALRLCRARSANVLTFDGTLVHIAAAAVVDARADAAIRSIFPQPVGRGTAASRAVLSCGVVAIPDVRADPDYVNRVAAEAAGFRSILAVPLMRHGRPIGAVAVGRAKPGPFSVSQVTLLQTFAEQAVIAIENARLFNEIKDALARQTATSDVLRVISGSVTDTQPVFDVIAERASRLTGANSGWVFVFDGEWVHHASSFGLTPEALALALTYFPMRPSGASYTARAIRDGAVVNVADALAESDPAYATKPVARAAGYRSVLSVPMLRAKQVIGAISVNRAVVGRFADKEVELLQTFADQAVIAIENARLFKELQERTAQLTQSVEQLRALSEVGQAVGSTLDLATVLRTIVAHATQLTGMDGGAIYEYDATDETFSLHTAHLLPPQLVEALSMPMTKGDGAIGRLASTRAPVAVADILDAGGYQSRVRELLVDLGYRSLLAVPLLREDRLLGGLVVNRKQAGAFEPRIVELLQTFATQSALAIQNARLFREIEDKGRQLEIASQHKSAFLANMSHELRTPLNAIIGFTRIVMRRSHDRLEPKQFENLEKILASGQHLLALINSVLDLAKVEAGRVEVLATEVSLPRLLRDCLRTVEPLLDAGVTSASAFDATLPPLHVDEEKLRQIVINLLSNAAKFTVRGRIELRAQGCDDAVSIAVADTGIGIPADKLDAIFEEFEQVDSGPTRAHGGTGLGLTIARRLARLMGGDLRAQSSLGAGSTFTLTLPLRYCGPSA